MDAPVATPSASTAQLMQRRRRSWLAAFAGALGVVAVRAALAWWLYASRYQSTDDAYVAGDLVSVMPQVSGTVVAIAADETDLVYAPAAARRPRAQCGHRWHRAAAGAYGARDPHRI